MSDMHSALAQELADYLIAMGDDELILAHRHSEWCGHAPILEEDIAFANLALDEIGHATVWYRIASDLLGEDPNTYPDKLVFFRGPEAYRCIQMMELPIGDWAFSMLRQYFNDSFEMIHLGGLKHSHHQPMAEAAAKIYLEEGYHFRHTQAWITRLGKGTDESHMRMQNALDSLWPYVLQRLVPIPGNAELEEANLVPTVMDVEQKWLENVSQELRNADLIPPDGVVAITDQRENHSEYLEPLLTEMQKVARIEPEGVW